MIHRVSPLLLLVILVVANLAASFSIDVPFSRHLGLTARHPLTQPILSGDTSMIFVDNICTNR